MTPRICPHCHQEMECPFGQFFYCKNDCDLKLKKIPEMVGEVTKPVRYLAEQMGYTVETLKELEKTLQKYYALHVGDDVALTPEGNSLWSQTWGSDGQVDPDSYPYGVGDRGTVLSVDTDFTMIQMLSDKGWWIKLPAKDVHTWFEKV